MDRAEQTRLVAAAEAYFRRNHYPAAARLLTDVLRANAGHSKANELMAYIAGNTGDGVMAHRLLESACRDAHCSAEALYYLGSSFLRQGRAAEAIGRFVAAIAKAGEFFEALHDLGTAQALTGDKVGARASFRKAVALRQDSHLLFYNLGRLEDEFGNFDEALECYARAIALDSNHAPSHYNEGVTLNEVRRYADALASFDQSLRLDPGSAHAWAARGATLCELGRYDEGLASYEKSLAIRPDVASVWANMGVALSEQRRHAEAVSRFERAASLDPDMDYVLGNLLYARMQIADWGGFAEGMRRLTERLDAGGSPVLPFALLSMLDEPALQLKAGRNWVNRMYPPRAEPLPRADSADGPGPVGPGPNGPGPTGPGPKRKIRIGYFSTDFRSHSVAFLAAELFELHDRDRFEVLGFSLRRARDSDPMRRRLMKGFDRFLDLEDRSDAAVARIARELAIDIAVDLGGHTQGSRTGIFAHRAAPVQVSFLGYPGTMGASYIDYVVADDVVAPPGNEAFFSEKLARLPVTFQVNDSQRRVADRAFSRAELGLPDEAFVYCCFNNVCKITPFCFDGWMRILKRVQHAVLWLVQAEKAAVENLCSEAEKRGVASSRLFFAERLGYSDYLARYRVADLVLDTLPFNGGTTTSDALWAGVPVLTRRGRTFAGRMAASVLAAAGLDELVADTQEQYESLAVELALRPEKLPAIRTALGARVRDAPLFDARLFTRHLEAAYARMHERHQSNLGPDDLLVTR